MASSRSRQGAAARDDCSHIPAQQQPIRVVVEKKPSGCWSAFGILLLIGLAVEYWYVSLGILVIVIAAGLIANARQQQQQKLAREQARRRPGPRDPWLNEVAVALADLELTEIARNTGSELGGMPLEGDIGLQAERFQVYINLFSDAERARQAELGLRATPKTRDAIASGGIAVKAVDSVLYVANGRGVVVDEFRLEEVQRTVGKIRLPPALSVTGMTGAPPAPAPAPRQAANLRGDALEQLKKLAELRDAGILTAAEFEAKKTELLRRV